MSLFLFPNSLLLVYFPSIVLYLFVRMSENTIAVQNFGAFLNKLFAGNLILLKREVDSYIVSLNLDLFLIEENHSFRVMFAHELANIVRQETVALEFCHLLIISQ